MSTNDLTFHGLYAELILRVPELEERVRKEFSAYYNLEEETPGGYPIFEDVVQEFLFEIIRLNKGDDLIRLFAFFEEMAKSNDRDVTDLLGIAIIEPLIYQREYYQRAKPYMGPKTAKFADLEEHEQNSRGVSGS